MSRSTLSGEGIISSKFREANTPADSRVDDNGRHFTGVKSPGVLRELPWAIVSPTLRMKTKLNSTAGLRPVLCATLISVCGQLALRGQQTGPALVDPNLEVRPLVTNLQQPTSMAFIGPDDLLVLEKASGKVQRVTQGVITSTVLDLAVNSGSERGLLGIALHPDFPANPGVYLYWTETLTNADTTVLSDTPLLGNRVDRFHWDGSALTFDFNLIHLRSFQADANQALRGNHNSGVI